MSRSPDLLGQFATLTAKQSVALPLLASGMPAVQVAKKVGISEQAISGWQKDENFVACLERARRESVERARNDLQLTSLAAVRVLADLLHSAKSESVRLKAAQYVCDRMLFNTTFLVARSPSGTVSDGEFTYLESVERQRNLRAMTDEFFVMLRSESAHGCEPAGD